MIAEQRDKIQIIRKIITAAKPAKVPVFHNNADQIYNLINQ